MLRTQSETASIRVPNCWEKEEDLGEFVNKLGSVLSGAQSGEARSLLSVVLFTSISRVNQRVGRKKCVQQTSCYVVD